MPTSSLHVHVCWHGHYHIYAHTQNKMKAKQEHKQTLQEGGEPTLGRKNNISKPLGAEINTAMGTAGSGWPEAVRGFPTIAEMPGSRKGIKLSTQRWS